MTVRILIGDVMDRLSDIPDDSVHCVVTSPPYWGLRDYGVDGQLGLEQTLGEHIDTMVNVFSEVRRTMRSDATLWLNYGDCYVTSPNGRSAADTKVLSDDDRTFRDKPLSTTGPIYETDPRSAERVGGHSTLSGDQPANVPGRIRAGGVLKPKDLCMVPNRLAIALQEDGWWVRSEIIWGKPNGMPDSSGRYRPSTAHEKIFMLSKSGSPHYDAEAVRMPPAPATLPRLERANTGTSAPGQPAHSGICGPRAKKDKQRGHSRRHAGFNDRWDNMTKAEQQANGRLLRNYESDLSPIIDPCVWHIATAAFSDAHFATFPPTLAATCIKAGCPAGGTVLDPFGGAGTTGLVADRMGRDAILIELNPEYAELARKRISDDQGMFGVVEMVA